MRKIPIVTRIFSILFQVCYTVTFFATTAVVVIVGFLALIFIWPFSKSLYRRITNYSYWCIISHVVFLTEWWSSLRVKIYVDKEVYNNYFGKEHAICLMNHRYEIDYLTLVRLSDKFKVSGNLKAYVKSTVQYIPIVGWCLYLVEYIFLTRSFDKDERTIRTQIKNIAENPNPVWIIFYPEGTRITSLKHRASRDWAHTRHLAPLRYHLQPRTKGFLASVPAARGHIPAIYDTELYVEDCEGSATFFTMLGGGARYMAHMYVERISVGEEVVEERDWLYQLFQKKDRIFEALIDKTFKFETLSGSCHVMEEPIELERNVMVVWNFVFWCFCCNYPLVHFLVKSVIWMQLEMFAFTCLACSAFAFLFWVLLWTICLTPTPNNNYCCKFCSKMT